MICFDVLWLTIYARDHDALLKSPSHVITFLPYDCYLQNSGCIVPPLVDTYVCVKLRFYILQGLIHITQAPEGMEVRVVLQYSKYCPNQTFIKLW
jgi:hypothetical protein